jgi:hypothetical protein
MYANRDRTELLNRRWTQINADEKSADYTDYADLLMGLAASGEISKSFLALAFLLLPSTISELKTKSA